MDYQVVSELASSQVVWAILCVLLAVAVIREMRKESVRRENDLINLYEDHRKESKRREERLMDHLDRSNESQEQTTAALKSIQSTLTVMEGRVDRMEKKLYQREHS